MNILYGNKVVLRPIAMEDTGFIVKWRNTEFVRDNFLFRDTFSEEMHMNWMNTKVKSGEVIQYIICDKREKPVGSVYFSDVDMVQGTAEFGIFIGEEEYLGMGFGKEATELFVQFGLNVLGFKCISLRVLSKNKCAIHVYEDSGFEIQSTGAETISNTKDKVEVTFMRFKGKL